MQNMCRCTLWTWHDIEGSVKNFFH
jgi:hypothetical protein